MSGHFLNQYQFIMQGSYSSWKEDEIQLIPSATIAAYQLDSFNSSPPSAAYVSLWIGSALVQIMAVRLFGAKLLSEPLLGYCQFDP